MEAHGYNDFRTSYAHPSVLQFLLRNIDGKRGSANPFWKLIVHARDLAGKVYFFIFFRLSVVIAQRVLHLKNHAALSNLINGKRILILGSGPSAKDFGVLRIPSDVLLFTCNYGFYLLKDRPRTIDLYLTNKNCMEANLAIPRELPTMKIDVLLMNDLAYLRKKKNLGNCYQKLLRTPPDNYYFERLIRPLSVSFRNDPTTWHDTSSGIKLLEYALAFRAKEIYLIGIDFGHEHVYQNTISREDWLSVPKQRTHFKIDRYFLTVVSKRYRNVFSISKESPVNAYLPYRPLE